MTRTTFAVTALLTLLGVGAMAPVASATEVTEDAKLAASLPIAEAAFEQTHCAAGIKVNLGRDYWPTRPDGLVVEGEAFLRGTFGDGTRDCELDLRGGLSPNRFCRALVHEYGHLAGHFHVDDVHDVMHPQSLEYEPCVTGTAALTAVAAARKSETIMPAPEVLTIAEELTKRVSDRLPKRFQWTVACRPLRTSEQERLRLWGTCRASAAGAKPRRYVSDRWAQTLYREELAARR